MSKIGDLYTRGIFFLFEHLRRLHSTHQRSAILMAFRWRADSDPLCVDSRMRRHLFVNSLAMSRSALHYY